MPPRQLLEGERPLAEAYLTAKEAVIRAGFAHEIDWQEERTLDELAESDFLRETAWVIICSGMRERVVRRLFGDLSDAFLCWSSAAEIAHRTDQIRDAALAIFRHEGKVNAILEATNRVVELGFDAVVDRIRSDGITFLQGFRFLGPATSYHLAKNLGMDVVKPDRHLLRVSASAGFSTPEELCSAIAEIVGDRIAVVDSVIWRYATLEVNYETLFRSVAESSRCSR